MEKWKAKWQRIRETYFGNVWDVLAWIAFAYLIIYATLKVIGVLHSPVQVDLAAIASVAYFIGKYAQRIDFCIREVEVVKQKISNVKVKLNHHDNRFVHIESKLA